MIHDRTSRPVVLCWSQRYKWEWSLPPNWDETVQRGDSLWYGILVDSGLLPVEARPARVLAAALSELSKGVEMRSLTKMLFSLISTPCNLGIFEAWDVICTPRWCAFCCENMGGSKTRWLGSCVDSVVLSVVPNGGSAKAPKGVLGADVIGEWSVLDTSG